jgi:uncharacterized membrane protein (UPF0127 family)
MGRGVPDSNRRKDPRIYCAFNETRMTFISMRLTPADTLWSRLRGLLGRLRLKSDEGIWVVPSHGIHTIGLLFPIDVIYLDSDYRVVSLEESLGSFRMGPLRRNCASVLELPVRTIYFSETQIGDQMLICPPEEMGRVLESETDIGGSLNRLNRMAGSP